MLSEIKIKTVSTEHAWLKKMAAEQNLDVEILKQSAKENWQTINVTGGQPSTSVTVGPQTISMHREGHALDSRPNTRRARWRMHHGNFVRC